MRYMYTVDGVEYQSGRAHVTSKAFRDRTEAEFIAENYDIGDTVPVYYDPSSPHHCTLILPTNLADAGVVENLVYLLIFLLFHVVFGTAAWLAIWGKSNAEEQS